MQPPPSSQLPSTRTLCAESCSAALGSCVVDMSMVLWRRVTPESPRKPWTPSLWVAPPPWFGSLANHDMPSMVAAGWAGRNSESWTTVLVPRSESSRPLLPLGVPPRKMQLRKVMFAPVTLTYPWKSFPVMTVPLLANVWSPLTTIRAVPGTTPVLPGPGLPVRGPTGPVDGRPDGRLPDGLGDRLADALGAADQPFRPDGESVTDGGLAQDAAG